MLTITWYMVVSWLSLKPVKHHLRIVLGEGDAFHLAGDILVALAEREHLDLVRSELMKARGMLGFPTVAKWGNGGDIFLIVGQLEINS